MTDTLSATYQKVMATGITAILLTGLLIGGPFGLAIVSGDGGASEPNVGYGYGSETPTTTVDPNVGYGNGSETPTTTATTVTDGTTSETTPGFTPLTGVVALLALTALATLRRR